MLNNINTHYYIPHRHRFRHKILNDKEPVSPQTLQQQLPCKNERCELIVTLFQLYVTKLP